MLDNCPCIRFAVSGNKLTLIQNIDATTNIIEALRCEFDFRSPEWSALAKTVTFTRADVDPKAVVLPVGQNYCSVPWEVLDSASQSNSNITYEIGVYGIADGVRLPTNKVKLTLKPGSYISASAPQAPTPAVYDQIMTAISGIDTISAAEVMMAIQDYCETADFASKAYVTNAVNGIQCGIVTETDPTVPSWAKQPTKPTYTAQEVGALPFDTVIPPAYNDAQLRDLVAAETNARIAADAEKASLSHQHDGYVDVVTLNAHNYATQTYVDNAITAIPAVPTNISALTNDAGYITIDEIPNLNNIILDLGDISAIPHTFTAIEAEALHNQLMGALDSNDRVVGNVYVKLYEDELIGFVMNNYLPCVVTVIKRVAQNPTYSFNVSFCNAYTDSFSEYNLSINLYEEYSATLTKNEIAPYIGDNGNWFIGATDIGVHAQGVDGKDALVINTVCGVHDEPEVNTSVGSDIDQFNRVPEVGDIFQLICCGTEGCAGRSWIYICHVLSVSGQSVLSIVDSLVEITPNASMDVADVKLNAPTIDGTYKLHCVVSGGVPTYSWVADT